MVELLFVDSMSYNFSTVKPANVLELLGKLTASSKSVHVHQELFGYFSFSAPRFGREKMQEKIHALIPSSLLHVLADLTTVASVLRIDAAPCFLLVCRFHHGCTIQTNIQLELSLSSSYPIQLPVITSQQHRPLDRLH